MSVPWPRWSIFDQIGKAPGESEGSDFVILWKTEGSGQVSLLSVHNLLPSLDYEFARIYRGANG